ncbi:hypothetical protein B0T14DRAFT_146593 [Immersiella caudata]|uniref:C2H2-type domain-containing protein n=1 Tax=Immersiella caudata TaxID=314043 RepID=A0AA39X6N4_9PEZI|nr:hypothetical protein B0T14DRAFT_146593 [Immersiella caudata]
MRPCLRNRHRQDCHRFAKPQFHLLPHPCSSSAAEPRGAAQPRFETLDFYSDVTQPQPPSHGPPGPTGAAAEEASFEFLRNMLPPGAFSGLDAPAANLQAGYGLQALGGMFHSHAFIPSSASYGAMAGPSAQVISPISLPDAVSPEATQTKHEQDDDGAIASDHDGRRKKPKRADKVGPGPSKKFACPYFKRNRAKYSKWTSCPGPGWDEVHRVKTHLYRRHALPIQCPRCWGVFKSDELLRSHLQQNPPCLMAENRAPVEGFTKDQEKRLRSRKKAQADTTDEDKWREIYIILFPDDDESSIPSPCKTPPTLSTPGIGVVVFGVFPSAAALQLGIKAGRRKGPATTLRLSPSTLPFLASYMCPRLTDVPDYDPTDFSPSPPTSTGADNSLEDYTSFVRREMPTLVRRELETIMQEFSDVDPRFRSRIADIVLTLQPRLIDLYKQSQLPLSEWGPSNDSSRGNDTTPATGTDSSPTPANPSSTPATGADSSFTPATAASDGHLDPALGGYDGSGFTFDPNAGLGAWDGPVIDEGFSWDEEFDNLLNPSLFMPQGGGQGLDASAYQYVPQPGPSGVPRTWG